MMANIAECGVRSVEAKIFPASKMSELQKETDELLRIMVASGKKAKRKR
jgi:hypothetical protein